jgi:DNA-binding NarL/FixJ family response regulator
MLGTLLRDLIVSSREEDVVVDRFASLSKREREVISLVAEGLDHEAISELLYLSPNTTRTHIQNVLRKLEVHSRLEAITLVTRYHLLERFATTESD